MTDVHWLPLTISIPLEGPLSVMENEMNPFIWIIEFILSHQSDGLYNDH